MSLNILGFLGASVLLTLMPGPDILFVITQSISQGKKSGIIIALGLCTGLIVHTTAASFGLSYILYTSEYAFSIVKYLGAAYLLYLGLITLIKEKENAIHDIQEKRTLNHLYQRGILMNLLNPKVSLFFLAFLPQFVKADSDDYSIQMLLLGVIFIMQAIIIFSIVSVLADTLFRAVMTNKKLAGYFKWVKSGVFFVIAISILVSKL